MANSGAGSKADAAVKLVLVFFVSLLSFSVGTFVGKKVSDANHRRADLENEYNMPGTQEREVASEQASPDTEAVSDEEIAALTKEFVEAERNVASTDETTTETTTTKKVDGYKKMGETETADKVTTTTTVKTTQMTKAKAEKLEAASNDKVKSAADRIAKDMAPVKDPKKVKKPSKALPGVATTAIGKYTVQVASYASEGEARVQVAKLKDKGYGAFYVPASVKGQTWYRVSIGLFTDQKSATNYRSEVLKSRVVNSAIVQRIVK